ncbi:dethiobiotin synthase [Pasteurellaceae bacterium LIM206]|nr:dethiobiotin synthase [Pasteurellaceae bacterium LIM206]
MHNQSGKVIFISGIDTDIGKTVATGYYAKQLMAQGYSVITQKMIQTGCRHIAEDLLVHRKIQGIPLTEEDRQGITCPYVFHYPCSPHLAAKLEQRAIDIKTIKNSTALLCRKYDYVLIEGAGGLFVPYNETQTTFDYLCEQNYPLILVTSGRLGSINHTLLNLTVCRQQGIVLQAVIYNLQHSQDDIICRETRRFLQNHLSKYFPQTEFHVLPRLIF